LDALRTERARRAWGAELGPDETPLNACLLATLPPEKTPAFIGQKALQNEWGMPLVKKLVRVRATKPDTYLWGGEPLVINDQSVGEMCSAGWGHEAGVCVGLAYVRGDWAARKVVAQAGHALLWGVPVPVLIEDLPPQH